MVPANSHAVRRARQNAKLSAGSNAQKMYYVYVLYSKKYNKFYIGYTDDLKRRLNEHKFDKVYTMYRMRDWKLTYCEACLGKKDATDRELQL